MIENPNQPKEDDVVLGGQTPPPLDAAVLGGVEGVKYRLNSELIEHRVEALEEALRYGDAGLELIIQAMDDEVEEVRNLAALLFGKPAQIYLLKNNLSLWNKWREQNFFEADLREANLSGINLSGADLRRAKLSEANLSGADLSFANLRAANLKDANLQGANLRKAKLIEANLWGVNLTSAKLNEATFWKADLRKAKLINADLTLADLCEAKLSEANFTFANLTEADLQKANLSKTCFWKANLWKVELRGANFQGTTMPDGKILD